MQLEDRVFVLNKAQIKRLIKRHSNKLSGTVTPDKVVKIVLPEVYGHDITVIDQMGNPLGYLTAKELWKL